MTNPWPTRRFGVEIEVTQYRDPEELAGSLKEFLRARQIPTPVVAYDGGIRSWVVKEDGSCGGEIATPAMTWERMEELKAVFTWIRSQGLTAGTACGMHVHHDFPGINTRHLRQLMVAWAAYQPVLNMFVTPRRIHNDFCSQLPSVPELYPELIPSSRGIQELLSRMVRFQQRFDFGLQCRVSAAAPAQERPPIAW